MKRLTAKKLYKFLKKLEEQGCDLSKIEVVYRAKNEEILNCYECYEDLFDSETNNILESIAIGYDLK